MYPVRPIVHLLAMVAMVASVVNSAAATFTVINTNDSGAGSLRQAILQANTNGTADTIEFQITNATRTITLASALPGITEPLTLTGATQPGYVNAPIVELNGNNLAADGLRVQTSNSTIRALVINRFNGDGIEIMGGAGNVVEGCVIGLNLAGSTDQGNTLNGIVISNAPNNRIGGTTDTQRNVIAGNNREGVFVFGLNATNNLILGNYIGLNATGTVAVANSINGVLLSNAPLNTVGGTVAGAGNLIGGNSQAGVRIEGTNATGNLVVGNTIGLGITGADLGNNGDGVHVLNAPGNRTGGALPGERNVISGNNGDGIEVNGLSSSNNLVLGNYIGPDSDGTLDRRNGVNGIFINNAPGTTIGGATAGEANLISRNQSDGIEINGLSASNTLVLGNWIGLDVTGTTNLGNFGHGIFVTSNARFNFLGATNVSAGNRIAFNTGDGVYVQTGTNNAIRGNNIWSNSALGIDLDNDGITANDAGDADLGANLRQNFPVITNAVLSVGNTLVQGTLNSIPNATFFVDFFASAGPDLSGNGEGQLYLGSATLVTGAESNAVFSVNLPVTVTIGRWITATATDTNGNTSEFSAAYRAFATLPGTTFTVVNTNDTGSGSFRQALLDANALLTGSPHLIRFAIPGGGEQRITLSNALPSLSESVIIDGFTQSGSSSNTLVNGNNANQLVRLQGSPAVGTGLTLESPSNVVRGMIFTGFPAQGVEVVSSNNVIEGCLFGITPAGATNGNDWGVVVRGSGNRIGGPLPGQRVVVSANSGALQLNFDSFNNVVQGCFVGTDIGGVGMKANVFDGIAVGGTNHVIGGASPGARNVVCGFGTSGINVGGFGHTVQGNLVGTDITGTNVLGNFNMGISLQFGAASNLIGGSVAGAGNLILGVSSPVGPCINVAGDGNVIQGNFIGTDATGTLAAGKTYGILVGFNSGNVIGGTNAGEGNVIAFNGEGVHISGTANAIRGNSIHSNTPGRGIALGNFINVNDPGDGDSGANEQQNYPTITNASGTLLGTTIQGFLSSKASTLYQLDFFSSVVRDAVNRGEGQKYLGSASVMTDGTGIGNFNVTVPGVMFGRQISATATDPAGNTSEFSDCVAATSTFAPSTNVVVNTSDSGPGSLRQALLNANTNASATPNLIAFTIPGAGPHVIRLLSALPPPVEWIAIEGFSQPGASANTSTNGDNAVRKIILDGSMAGAGVNGLTFEADSNIVRGLVIQNFYGNGIAFSSNSTGNVVEGSFITGNTNSGVLVNSANNRIGGTTSAARNILSGNRERGVTLLSPAAQGNLVAGNYIGTDLTGSASQSNRLGGILISSASVNIIGGSEAGRNIISGNGGPGVEISSGTNNLVQGNHIGSTPLGAGLGNTGDGVLISSSSRSNIVGVPLPGAGGQVAVQTWSPPVSGRANQIVYNGGAGIRDQGNFSVFRQNHYGWNSGLAADIGFSGVTPNTPAGARNFPVITSALINPDAGTVNIQGTYNGPASSTLALDFHTARSADITGYGEGHKFIGTISVTTDAAGNAPPFNHTFNAVQAYGEFVTAHASSASGSSESSLTVRAGVVDPANPPTLTVTVPAGNGLNSFPYLVNVANALPGVNTITFAVSRVVLDRGVVFTSPIILNGDLGGGQKVLITGEKMTTFDPLLEFRANDNWVWNLAIAATPFDGMKFNGFAQNEVVAVDAGADVVPDASSSGPAVSGAIGGSAIVFTGTPQVPAGENTNKVRQVRITNVRANAISASAGNKVEVAGSVEVQSINSGIPFSIAGGPSAPTPVNTVDNGNGTITTTWNVFGPLNQFGKVKLLQWEASGGGPPSSTGRGTSVAEADYTITSGNSAIVSFVRPKVNFQVGYSAFQVTGLNTSGDSQMELDVPTSSNGQNDFSSANNGQSYVTDDPVNLFTGEYFDLLAPDLDLGGPLPLVFQRYYASLLLRDGKSFGRLGNNWRHNFEWSLTNKNTTIEIVSPMGRVITFTNDSFNFTLLGRQDIPYQLIYFFGSGDFMLADPLSQTAYRFDPSGQLIFITDARDNSHHLSYSGTLLTNVTDGLGRALSFSYSASGFLTKVSDGTRSVGFGQSNSNLVQSVDALGKVSTNRYATFPPIPALLTHRNRPLGNTRFTQTYDTAGRVSQQQQSESSGATRFAYGFNLCVQTDPDNFVREFYHNDNGEFTGFADESGIASTMTYNASGQRASVKDRRGLTTRVAYHAPSGRIAAITNADGSVIQFTYTNRSFGGITFHDLSKVTFPDGTSESYIYDGSGNVISMTDPAGRISGFSWNARGQLLSATNPTGGVVTFTYNFDGTPATAKDSETGLTSYFYDSLRRLTNIVHPDGTSRRWQFDANDRLLSLTDERTNTTTFAYDANDRLILITDANGGTAGFAYDNADRIVTVTNSSGNVATIEYDDRGHVSAVTDFNGTPTSFGVDSRHRLEALAQGGTFWQFGYNNEAQLASVTNALSQASRFTLDELGFTIGATNPLGQANAFALDVMRRLTNSVDALQRADRFTYDPRGLLASATAPVIGTASYVRNDLGLLTRITGLNSEQWHFGYSPIGRLQFVADPLNRTNRFGYDIRGRQTTATFADGTTLTNTFDSAGNLVREQFSAGPDLVYAYDKVNRLTNAADVALAYDSESRLTNTLSAGVNYGATYDVGGRLASVRYHNGAFTVTYTYNSQDQLISVNDSLTGTFLQFVYDPAGRLINILRPNGVNSIYSYDAAGRLTRVQDGTIVDVQYTLDAAGQVAMAGFTAPLDPATLITNTQSAPFTHDAAHQINSAGYGYDARGRLNASPWMTFIWDGASRLTGIGAVALGYNGLGDLITRTEGGVTTRFFRNYAIDLAPIMAERNETTVQVQRYYVWSPSGRLLYMIDAANGNAVRHYHVDRVGSTLALTSAAGAVTDAYAYTPYGELLGRTGTSAQPFTYVGAYGVRSEPAAILYHMRARYYDPLTARFLSREPIWPVLGQPRGLDPYQYAYGEPMRFIDRTGLDAEDASSTHNRVGFVRDYSVIRVGYVNDYSQIVKRPSDSFHSLSPHQTAFLSAFATTMFRDFHRINRLSGGFAAFLLFPHGGHVPNPDRQFNSGLEVKDVPYMPNRVSYLPFRPEVPSGYPPDLPKLERAFRVGNRLSGGLLRYVLRKTQDVNVSYLHGRPSEPDGVSYTSPTIGGFEAAAAAWTGGDLSGIHYPYSLFGSTSANNWGSLHLGLVLGRNQCPQPAEAGSAKLANESDESSWGAIFRAQRGFYP